MNSMNQIHKGTVFITGASSGIGYNTALAAIKEGYRVILAARRLEKLEKLQQQCNSIKTNSAIIYQLDLYEIDQVESVITKVLSNYSVDILVNNAGIGLTKYVKDLTYKDIETVFRVNVLSLMYITKLFAAHFVDQKHGHIIQIGSLAAKVPTQKTSVYSASKAAVLSFNDVLRQEVKPHNIFVTTVNFGPVDTEFFQKVDTSPSYTEKVKPFMLSEEAVSKKIVSIMNTDKREVNKPLLLAIGTKLYQLVPSLGDRLLSKIFRK